MKILLIISSFNSLSQGVYCKLKDLNHDVKIRYSISNDYLKEECEKINPDLIFCPFLKEFLSKDIYEKWDTFVLHPGPLGDRGHNSIDYALYKDFKEWGVVILKANELLDGGDIYAKKEFLLEKKAKASIYRDEVCKATISILEEFLENYQNKNFKAIKQILNPIHETISQDKRVINWQKDSSEEIINKINLSDSYPGVKDELLGVKCFLYGAKKEHSLKGSPKELLAKRDGAICLGTIDGAIWISHIKEEGSFKLPSTYVLKDKLKGLKENRLPLLYEGEGETYWEIKLNQKEEIAYLYFNFYNGAMSSSQAIQLKYAIEYLKEECKVLVLMGGEDFFSNGIHLNILEDSKKQGEDGWSNINAINE
ncbi:MAG: formyltransferase family protein, partial [Campylobacterales bacterium]|nr:formyltransferase family protein [Campylobacterales bacterium]